MKELEERILKDGVLINNEILKVDSFVNHQIDVPMLKKISEYIANGFDNQPVDKVLTIETSGIAYAVGVSYALNFAPVVFAKKSKSKINDATNVYATQIKSFTRNTISDVTVDKRFLKKGEKVLIVDDFLAEGNASLGLIDICNQAGCEVIGIGIVVEKGFQGGRKKLEDLGYKVVSAATIKEFKDNKVIFEERD